ncbi:MAG: hotdog domain-containing protein [Parasphingorhabdus sp.]|uniref:acyl-CoA thioesterase n=1 Tax=Parasphingorhabdus sp. TaxID=2709688 RepID=UPI0030037122
MKDKIPAIRTITMPTDTNPYGSVFGGWLMGQMAQGCAALAAQHSKRKCVVVGANELRFERPVNVGDELSVFVEFAKIGRSSMIVRAEAYSRERHSDEMMKAASGEYTFVALDENNQPAEVRQKVLF